MFSMAKPAKTRRTNPRISWEANESPQTAKTNLSRTWDSPTEKSNPTYAERNPRDKTNLTGLEEPFSIFAKRTQTPKKIAAPVQGRFLQETHNRSEKKETL